MTRLGGITFAYYIQFLPNMQALVLKHLHKAIETPIIVHQPVADLSFPSFFTGLVFLFLGDHLLLGKITYYHSSFSQLVGDEMRGFMQAVPLFPTLLFGYSFVDFREIDVSSRFLLAFISFGPYLIQLLVVPSIA